MQVQVRRRLRGELNLPLIYLLITVVLSVTALGLLYLNAVPVMLCPFKEITGLPCPTCGATRMVHSLLDFHILEAFYYNPGLMLGGIVFGVWCMYGLYSQLSGRAIRIRLSRVEGHFIRAAVILIVLLNWIYLVIAGI